MEFDVIWERPCFVARQSECGDMPKDEVAAINVSRDASWPVDCLALVAATLSPDDAQPSRDAHAFVSITLRQSAASADAAEEAAPPSDLLDRLTARLTGALAASLAEDGEWECLSADASPPRQPPARQQPGPRRVAPR